MTSSQLRRAAGWTMLLCLVLLSVGLLLTVVVDDLLEDGNRVAASDTVEASIVLTSLARAVNDAVWQLTVGAGVFLVASAALVIAASVIARREVIRPPDERMEEKLDEVLSSVGLLKEQVSAGRRDLETAKEEKARVVALLSTSREQLAAIEKTLAPGARLTFWIGIGGLALGLLLFVVDRVLSGGF